jgi:hypothetical protein
MSLEGLSPSQINQLATGMQALLNSTDTDVRRGAQRLLKKVDNKLNFPELDMQDAIESAIKPVKEESEALKSKLQEEEFRRQVQEDHKRVVARGFKVDDVQKVMKERGIVNFDTAMNIMDMEQRLATPTPESVSGVYNLPDESKEIFKNPAQWARKTAHQLIDQLQAKKRA